MTTEQEDSLPKQTEMPFAIVAGKAVTEVPHDLYIPPDALEVFLEAFEGPLDLLLYLIKKENLDVLDISVSRVATQYTDYIALMTDMKIELASEYLVMAAMLAEIKSRLLLPQSEVLDDEEDPRAELIRRLQEYERFKNAAEKISELPKFGEDVLPAFVAAPKKPETVQSFPVVSLQDLMMAFAEVMRRADMFEHHHVRREVLSVREKMTVVLDALAGDDYVVFSTLFNLGEGRPGVVATFLAVLELVKMSLIELTQNGPYDSIYVRRATDAH